MELSGPYRYGHFTKHVIRTASGTAAALILLIEAVIAVMSDAVAENNYTECYNCTIH